MSIISAYAIPRNKRHVHSITPDNGKHDIDETSMTELRLRRLRLIIAIQVVIMTDTS